MKTVTKEYHVLEKKDLEKVLSEQFDRQVTLAEVECTLQHCMPADEEAPNGAYLEFSADEDTCDSFDLFWDDDKGGHFFDGVQLALENEWPTPDELFAFDVSEFADFSSEVDDSD